MLELNENQCHLFETNNPAIHFFISKWNKSWNSYLLCWTEYFEKCQYRNKEILNFSIFTAEVYSYAQTEVFCLTHGSCLWWSTIHLIWKERVWPRNTSPQEGTWVWDI